MARGLRGRRGPLARGRPPSGPTGQALPPSSLSLPGRARRLQAVPTGRRGNRAPPDRNDVKGGVATVPRRAEISACTGHCGRAVPWIWGDGLYCSHILSCLLNGGADFEGVVGRLLGAGPSWGRLLVLGRLQAAGRMSQPAIRRRRFILDVRGAQPAQCLEMLWDSG
jgi:hypothetical protein